MERTTTAQIDMQKLQILNDRILHCLDALNQVRLSAQPVLPTVYGQNIGAYQYGRPQTYSYGISQNFMPGLGYGYTGQQYSPVWGGQAFAPTFDRPQFSHVNGSAFATTPVVW